MATTFEFAPAFDLTEEGAQTVAREVAHSVQGWRETAARHGIGATEIERFEATFDGGLSLLDSLLK